MGVDNYARFYGLLKRLPGADKETLVLQFTNGRTTHLHLMAAFEYRNMCNALERVAGYDERREEMRRELRCRRSSALHLMQLYGVDTADWGKVDAFCRDRRIAGKEFRRLDCAELEALDRKLRAMISKKKIKS